MGLDQYKSNGSDKVQGGSISGKYTEEDIIDKLQEFYNQYGVFTIQEYMDNVSSPSYSTIKRRFGSMNEAKEKAGIPLSTTGIKRVDMDNTMREPSSDQAYVIGCLITDGWVVSEKGSHTVGMTVKDKEFAAEFGKRLSSWLDLRWDGFNSNKTEMEARGPIEKGESKGLWNVKKGSKELVEFVDQHTESDLIDRYSNYKSELLNAMWSAEGSVSSGQVKFGNEDVDILLLYMEILDSISEIELDMSWEWASNREEYRKYGDFVVSTKISNSDVRNVTLNKEHLREFSNVIDTPIERKSEKLNQ